MTSVLDKRVTGRADFWRERRARDMTLICIPRRPQREAATGRADFAPTSIAAPSSLAGGLTRSISVERRRLRLNGASGGSMQKDDQDSDDH
jgi:hypothetical protein